MLWKQEVPIKPFVATIAHIVTYQKERMLARLPVHSSVAAFTFRTDIMETGILTAYGRQDLTSFPLKGKPFDAGTQPVIA